MGYFLLFQIVPFLLLWIVFSRLGDHALFRRAGVPVIFLLGALLQGLLWYFSHPNLDNPDSLGYFRLGHGLETDLKNILFRPKLYPVFLGFFTSLKTATFFQCVLKVGAGFFILRFSRLLDWRPGTGAFILFLYLFNSIWLQEPLHIMDTTLFTFLFTAFLWLAVETAAAFSYGKFMALCVVAGMASLTRQVGDPSMAAAGGSLVLALVMGKRVGPAVLLFPILLGILIAASGLVFNGAKYGVYKRTVALGNALYTHASYYELSDPASREWRYVEHFLPGAGKRYPAWTTDYAQDIPWPVNALPHNLERAMKPYDAETILACDRELARRFLLWAGAQPGRYLASVWNEAMRMLWKCEEYYPDSLLARIAHWPVFILRLERGILHQPVGFLLGLALAALALERRRRLLLFLPILGMAAYLFLVAAIHLGFTRYALPTVPCLLILAGHACDRVTDRVSPRTASAKGPRPG